ncbi:maleylpyruvate isomerase family mycothiol-dependent enzyme [Kribbella sandramycini]|uniref:Maleylpyruvate isomerase family mycothiol-dependent enzyme n=1 Tax=Kribbella sandramycini TaxID=60450 RepID=A0A7Y4KVU7_9ACTN|nr:maleylpyruvate isomerase family mycothiol-dependent enzyme [Kribbella sandramycini]MBB6567766.1 uncharacterized protein (TIGR03083 family) [Kribbella sandramycini]NOL39638.1 maleylpyruvate isomerase family mycothiol-dependent enzyme [Kribbella sandramycini]
MTDVDAVIAALRTGHDRLAELVKTFGEAELAAQSAASEWDIAQVLSHLGSGAEIMGNAFQLALEGQPPGDKAYNKSVWKRWNGLSRREQADNFLDWNEKFVVLFESLDSDQRRNLRVQLSFLPEPTDVATYVQMRLNELTFHSWDVRSPADPTLPLDSEAVPHLLRTPVDPSWITKPASLNGRTAVVGITTTEPATEFTLRLGDPVSIEWAPAANADATLTLPAEAWLRLSAGRLDPAHTPDSVKIYGAVSLDTIRGVFAGF